MFKTATKLGEYSAMDEALINFIKQLPDSTVGEEYATEQGRITIYNEPIVSEDEDDNNDQGETEEEEEGNNNQGGIIDEDSDEGSHDQELEDGNDEDSDEGSHDQELEEDNDEENKEESPQTGDNNMIAIYGAMFIISAFILTRHIVISRKKA